MKRLQRSLLLVFLLISVSKISAQNVLRTSFKKDSFNVIKYGAKADGITINTVSIQKAIDVANKKGGGVVVIPKGLFISGPLVLKSNVNLHLQRGAFVLFSDDFNQYPLVAGNWEGIPQMRNQSPVSATNATNIAITGYGILDGNGDAWRMVKKSKLTDNEWKRLVAKGGVLSKDKKTWYPSEKSLKGSEYKNPGAIEAGKDAAFYDSVKDFLRPNMVVFTNCNKVLMEGVTFQNSPAWCLHPLMSKNIVVKNVTVNNPWYAQNGDGIDVESCSNVLIENSVFDVGDDGLCIKSGRDAEGRKRGMPTKNVWIKNCTVYHAHGGFVIGSEMSGGANNIWVDNCTFIGTDIGLRFKTTRGRGGVVENIFVNNITMKDIVGEAILFDMYYAAVDPIALAGENREAPKVVTYPVTEETPVFKKIYINNVVCNGAEKAIFVRGLPEMNIQDISLKNITIKADKGLDMTEASNIEISKLALHLKHSAPLFSIHNSKNISLNDVKYENVSLLMDIKGDKTANIKLTKTDKSKAAKFASFTDGASESSLKAE